MDVIQCRSIRRWTLGSRSKVADDRAGSLEKNRIALSCRLEHNWRMLAKVCSAAVNGIEAYPVEVEVNAGWGDTLVVIVGLPDAAVKESRDRVSTALTNSGFKFPMGRTTVNLAPADVKKEGPSFDLPIAVGMLAASEQFVSDQLENFVMVGELALTGGVRSVKGALPIALRAKAEDKIGLLVPKDNAAEAAVVKGLQVIPIQNLREAVGFLEGEVKISPTRVDLARLFDQPREIQNYLNRISGPLLDRIDLHVEVPAVKFREITVERTGEASAQIRVRVVAARRRQQERFAGKRNITCNARMATRELKAYCALDESTMELLRMAMTELKLSARAYDRILKVARTIADLAGSETLTSDHISEAIQYRSLDRQLWA